MNAFLTYTILGVVTGCIYAVSASGLVVTYTTSGIFNFAHGAIGMIAAFFYWQLTRGWHWPVIPALLITLLVVAPLFGAIVERALVRRLEGAPLEVNLVVTVGLLVFLIGLANLAWNPTKGTRTLPQFFLGHSVRLFNVNISIHELIVVGVAAVLAVALRVFFSRTRTGIAMRAVVDNRDLAEMAGARPAWIGQLSWALGSSLAALAGILLAPLQTLDILLMTLAIIAAFAAAVAGRLKSLPQTAIGALIIGLAQTYVVGYVHIGWLSRSQSAIPMVVMFVVLIAVRQERLRTSRMSTLWMPPLPSLRRSIVSALVFVAAAAVVSGFLNTSNMRTASHALAIALMMLSLVLLTGYGGQLSLCQMTFVGVGAYAMGHIGGHSGSLLGVIAAVAMAAGFGVLVAIPTVRLRGLYLALATLAFAEAMDSVFFTQVFGAYGGGLTVARVHIPGVPTHSDRAFFILLAVVFAIAGVGVLAIRRSRHGRRLAALNDSPAACATLGVNIAYTKLIVFAVAAGIAGLAGAMYGGVQGIVTPNDFITFLSLSFLLLLLVGGRNTVAGALLGATMYALFTILASHFHTVANLQYLLTGLAAISIGQNPDGIGGQLAAAGEQLRASLGGRRAAIPVPREEESLVPALD